MSHQIHAAVQVEIPTPRSTDTLREIKSVISERLVRELKAVVKNHKFRLQRRTVPEDWNAVDYSAFILEELVENAGRWGNKLDSNKRIWIRASFNSDGIFVEVRDSGEQAFNPAQDPFSLQEGETYGELKERRQMAGKQSGQGLFWVDAKNDATYAYEFDSGSRLVLFTPWSFLHRAFP